MKWENNNNKICINNNGVRHYPNAVEIIDINNKKIFNGIHIDDLMDSLSIRISKICLNVMPSFVIKQGDIFLELITCKNDVNYLVKTVNGIFLDYVIINNVLYMLSNPYKLIRDFIVEKKLNIEEKVDYKIFMEITRYFNENDIKYFEDVIKISQNIKKYESDSHLNANLFKYQERGVNWLKFMFNNKCGCILADEMGLGKTLQIIALLGYAKSKLTHSHFLIIAPVSLLENWKREVEKFYDGLSILVHHGPFRTGSYLKLNQYDIIITSYSHIHTDLSMFNMIRWDIVVLDEAQNIKNPYANRTKDVKALNRDMGIAVTGTPFENHMTDLWSLIDYAIPNYCGSLSQYEKLYDDTYSSAIDIEKLLTPIMIRRRVKEVADDLPERIDIPHPILMTEDEASFYDQNRLEISNSNKLNDISIDKIQKLRMFCTHPLVYNPLIKNEDPTLISNKYSLLVSILDEIISNNEKTIIFTSFNKMIELMVKDIEKRFGIYINYINGSTDVLKRQSIIDEFSKVKGAGVLVLNPKAAGTGLNITSANHVIHYNLEWNPAIEDQASARAYRRGQNKTVFIHRLFYVNTIDEVINDRIQLKRELSEIAVVGNNGSEQDKKDLLRVLALSPIGGVSNGT